MVSGLAEYKSGVTIYWIRISKIQKFMGAIIINCFAHIEHIFGDEADSASRIP